MKPSTRNTTRNTVRRTNSHSPAPLPPTETTQAEDTLLEQAKHCYREYGIYTIEQRAIPDFRDGLKPVQRKALWAMFKLNLKPSGKQVKSARVVGEIIGKYSPHGDQSAYQAMVNMAGTKAKGASAASPWFTKNTPEPLIWGFGNWGSAEKEAAAYRYSECKLSQYAADFLLDPEYLRVMDYLPNFDDTTEEPVLLPAKLPNVLLNGAQGISVGITTSIPSFARKGVIECAKLAIAQTLTDKDIIKHLKPSYAYGGHWDSKELANVISGTQNYLTVSAQPELCSDNAIRVRSLPPNMRLSRLIQILESLDGTASVADETGPDGFCVTAKPKRMSPNDRIKWYEQATKRLVSKDRVTLNLTQRHPDGSVTFSPMSLLDIFTRWADWRVEIERKVISLRLHENALQLHKLQLLLKAAINPDALASALKAKDASAYLQKHLSVSSDDANWLLEQPLKRFRSLERKELQASIAAHEKKDRALQSQLKAPRKGILDEMHGWR